jgi:hypothetical protein
MGEIARRSHKEQLDLLSQAEGLLERASTPAELVHVSDLAQTISGHAKRARAGLEAQNAAAEIHLRAQRKLGQMLERIDLNKGGRPTLEREASLGTGTTSLPVSLPTLKELGIPSKMYSTRAQLIAGWPEEDFEAWIEECKGRERELTISAAREQANFHRYRARRQAERDEAARRLSHLALPERVRLIHGDFTEILSSSAALPEGQVDAIITDAPYGEEHLPLWDELARASLMHLKPGHYLIAYSGQAFLDEVICCVREAAGGGLKWHWQYAALNSKGLHYRDRLVYNWWKPVLVWRRSSASSAKLGSSASSASQRAWELWQLKIADKLAPGKSPEEVKYYHEWAQPLEQAITLVNALCPPGGLVLDPMMGSATVPLAALQTGRRAIGIEIDEGHYLQALERVSLQLEATPK